MKLIEFEFLQSCDLLEEYTFSYKQTITESEKTQKKLSLVSELEFLKEKGLSRDEAYKEIKKSRPQEEEKLKNIIGFIYVPETLKNIPVFKDELKDVDKEKTLDVKKVNSKLQNKKFPLTKSIVNKFLKTGIKSISMSLIMSTWLVDNNIQDNYRNYMPAANEIIKTYNLSDLNQEDFKNKINSQTNNYFEEENTKEDIGSKNSKLSNQKELLDLMKFHEGFRPYLYNDDKHISFGYGTQIIFNDNVDNVYKIKKKDLNKFYLKQLKNYGLKDLNTGKDKITISSIDDVIKLLVKNRFGIDLTKLSNAEISNSDFVKNNEEIIKRHKALIKKRNKKIANWQNQNNPSKTILGYIKAAEENNKRSEKLIKRLQTRNKYAKNKSLCNKEQALKILLAFLKNVVEPSLKKGYKNYELLNNEDFKYLSFLLKEATYNVGPGFKDEFTNFSKAVNNIISIAAKFENNSYKNNLINKGDRIKTLKALIKEINKAIEEITTTGNKNSQRYNFYRDKLKEIVSSIKQETNTDKNEENKSSNKSEAYTLKNAYKFIYG